MPKKISIIGFLLLLALSVSVYAQQKTVINDTKAKNALLGKT